MGHRGPLAALLARLGSAHTLLIGVSLLCGLALIVLELCTSGGVGGPIGLFIAACFFLNAGARVWLRGRLAASAR